VYYFALATAKLARPRRAQRGASDLAGRGGLDLGARLMGRPTQSTVQRSFAGGELAPALHARADTAKYVTGLRPVATSSCSGTAA
jgi:hypothetical protein